MPHIVVFDSGIGGTSVLAHIQNALPKAQFSYVMDNALLPYGLQSQQTIINRLSSLLIRLQNLTAPVDLIVIACNTASTYALDTIRTLTSIPIVGVVPAIKPAASLSRSKRIALLATPATSANKYTQGLVKDFAIHCQVDFHESTELVKLAESKYWRNEDVEQAVHDELHRIGLSHDVDHLVLGCTHFPILSKELKQFYGEAVTLIDSGAAIARRVSYLVERESIQIKAIKKPLQFYATAPESLPSQLKTEISYIDLS